MDKDFEYYKIMFANETALSLESIEDIRKAGKWIIEQIERLEKENLQLYGKLNQIDDIIQKGRNE